jgi:hypothetical protein
MEPDDAPRFVLTARLMFSSRDDANRAAHVIDTRATDDAIASEYVIDEV